MEKIHRFNNKEVVAILKEMLAAMEVKDFNKFRVRAYSNAISAIDNLTSSVYDLWENHRLGEIPGVGPGLEAHLDELFKTGDVVEYKEVKKDLPQGMFVLIGIRGIGAKKAFKLANAFKLTDRETAIEKVREAAEAGRIRVIESFGEKSEKDILDAITESKLHKAVKPRLLLYQAEEIAERIITYMKELDYVSDVTALGSLRRRMATVGDLDIAVCSTNSEGAIEHFVKFPEIHEIVVRGEQRVGCRLKNDIQVDLRVTNSKAYGAMLQYFTGSKQHNVLLRQFALDKKLSLNEYGIKDLNNKSKMLEFPDEKTFYNKVGLDYIPPELRQGKDEIEKAKTHKLPQLVELSEIKGDIHTHTVASDGVNTLEEMLFAAKRLKYEYFGIADHAPSVQTRGYDMVADIIKTQKERFAKINESEKNIKLLFGYEVNILADATMQLPDELLAQLDYVIASLHTSLDQDRATITNRLVKALENPYVTIIGHPSGRLINSREGADIDWNKVFDAAEANHKILEINSQPQRLDLADDLVRDAIDRGIKLIINTDSHDTESLLMMKYGIDVARRGFAEAKNIINTLSYEDFVKELDKSRKR